jgi:cytochrome P450 (family 4 subfamily F)
MSMKESLRLHPPGSMISLCCIQDILLLDDLVISSIGGLRVLGRRKVTSGRTNLGLTVVPTQQGTSVTSIFRSHHNPSVWPDPEV